MLFETHLTDEVDESGIQRYNQYSTLSKSNKTGSVITYLKKNLEQQKN